MWEGLLTHTLTHFGGHLSQGLSNYPPDRIWPGQRDLPGHKTLNAEPGEGRANADNWSPELLRCSEQQVKGLQSPSPHQQPQLLYFYPFLPTRFCLHLFEEKSSVDKKGFEKDCPRHHSPDPCQPKPRRFRDSAFSETQV